MKRNCQQKLKYTSLAAMIAFTLSTGLVYGADMPVDGKVVAGKVTIDGTEYIPAVGDMLIRAC